MNLYESIVFFPVFSVYYDPFLAAAAAAATADPNNYRLQVNTCIKYKLLVLILI